MASPCGGLLPPPCLSLSTNKVGDSWLCLSTKSIQTDMLLEILSETCEFDTAALILLFRAVAAPVGLCIALATGFNGEEIR